MLVFFLDVGTPVKTGIYFHRTPSTTSTVTKPPTSQNTKQATPSVPLASPSQRSKFTFTIPLKSKGVTSKSDLNKTNTEGRELEEKSEKGKASDGMESLSTGEISKVKPDLKSPITSAAKKLETVPESELLQTATKPEGVKEELKEPIMQSSPVKKEVKGKADSPLKKPRPPHLFIPRSVAQATQGKGTTPSASK